MGGGGVNSETIAIIDLNLNQHTTTTYIIFVAHFVLPTTGIGFHPK